MNRDRLELVTNRWDGQTVEDQIRTLFEADGTVYLVSGFFTANAFQVLRPEIEAFLERAGTNELVIVAGPAADQFAPAIARGLAEIDADSAGTVRLYKYPDGFLHAKLYVRTGESPLVIIGSANLTRVAFEQNFELSIALDGEHLEDDQFDSFVAWIDRLLSECEPMEPHDLARWRMLSTTISNWANKSRLNPTPKVFGTRLSYAALLVLIGFLWFTGLS